MKGLRACIAGTRSAVSVRSPIHGQRRFLNLHEYQSKDLMESFGTRVQKGKMAETAAGAKDVATWIKTANPKAELILKSQIHAGGRGKGVFDTGFKGGVKICETPQEVEALASQVSRGDVGAGCLATFCPATLSPHLRCLATGSSRSRPDRKVRKRACQLSCPAICQRPAFRRRSRPARCQGARQRGHLHHARAVLCDSHGSQVQRPGHRGVYAGAPHRFL